VRTVYTHANCPDGYASAVIVVAAYKCKGLRATQEVPDVVFVDYKEINDIEPHPGAMFVDMCPRNQLEKWAEVDPIILDHHETSLKGLLAANASLKESRSPFLFDSVRGEESKEVCGAILALEHVFCYLVPRSDSYKTGMDYEGWGRLASLSNVRDNWLTGDPQWEYALQLAEGFRLYGHNVLQWVYDGTFAYSELLHTGKYLYERKTRVYGEILAGGIQKSVKGASVVFAQTYDASDFSEWCRREHGVDITFSIGYSLSLDEARVSLRTNDLYPIAAKFCEMHGGGGHPPAAGCNIKLEGRSLLELVEQLSQELVPYCS